LHKTDAALKVVVILGSEKLRITAVGLVIDCPVKLDVGPSPLEVDVAAAIVRFVAHAV
jgi:hypothetical protein